MNIHFPFLLCLPHINAVSNFTTSKSNSETQIVIPFHYFITYLLFATIRLFSAIYVSYGSETFPPLSMTHTPHVVHSFRIDFMMVSFWTLGNELFYLVIDIENSSLWLTRDSYRHIHVNWLSLLLLSLLLHTNWVSFW